jgi:hypothetical protein
MGNDRHRSDGAAENGSGRIAGRLMGSLRDALAAAGREDPPSAAAAPAVSTLSAATIALPALPPAVSSDESRPALPPARQEPASPSAAEAARDARGGTIPIGRAEDRHVEIGAPTTRVIRATPRPEAPRESQDDSARTQLIRGKATLARTEFLQDPVVGWLVVVGGPGLGAFRPIFEGNNTLGRSPTQRIPIDFGDDTISSEEQAYVRYDSADRIFLLVPNLAKTNVVAVNEKKPTSAVQLAAMDLITVGRTQLVFVPFCGAEFDWAELSQLK